jgi:hypothetical protein
LNRAAGIAAVATGCPAANCDAARAACGGTASRVGARACVFHIQQDAGAVGDAPQLRGGRLADSGEEHQLGAGNFFPGGQAPAQSIAGGSGKVRLGQTSACLAPARSSSASRRRAASIRIDCGASLRHERLESAHSGRWSAGTDL